MLSLVASQIYALTCEAYLPFTVNVKPASNNSYTEQVCKGGSYSGYGFNLTNVQKDTVCYLEEDCNKTTLTLTVYSNPVTNLYDSICKGSDYTDNGFSLQNVQRDTVCSRVNGCDTYTLHLTVGSDQETDLYATICEGSTYNKNGFNEISMGEYTQFLKTRCGCDSTVTLYLDVIPSSTITLYDDFCTGTPYTGRGFTDIKATKDTVLENNSQWQGCPSTVKLYLTSHNPQITQFTDTVKRGELYQKNNFDFKAYSDTTAVQELATTAGCDSIVTLYLTVCEDVTTTIYDTICSGNTYTKFNFNESTKGTYMQNQTTILGCDSTVTLYLEVIENEPTLYTDKYCIGSEYSGYGFENITATKDTLLERETIVGGCPAVVQLQLTAYSSQSTQITDSVTKGTEYYKFDLDFIAERDTTVTIYTTTAQGCDSIITIYVRVKQEQKPDEPDEPDTPDEPDEPDTPDVPDEPEKKETDHTLRIPLYFTPDGDGSNDVWTVLNTQYYPSIIIEIYDRYGRKLVVLKGEEGWDGTYNGHQMPRDDYWYVIRRVDDNKTYTGHFILKR